MKTPTSKLLAVILLLGGGACASTLHAQTSFALPFSLTQSSPATAFSIDTNGTLIESGPTNTSATLTLSGNPQMVWFPAKIAFRVGAFSGSQTQASIGPYSFATGTSTASGFSAVALGGANASGVSAVSMGSGTMASGYVSTALGGASTASGEYSLAEGYSSVASGMGSTAMGSYVTASGFGSTATGSSTTASGADSTATGQYTTANSQSAFVAGQYNVGLSSTGATPSATSWVATDPLVEFGNGSGTGSTPKSDAVVVYKNGNMTVQGVVTVAAGGDIPMYTGN